MTHEWITDRLPTAADGDPDGDVRMLATAEQPPNVLAHWSSVGAGAPWQRTAFWRPPAKPTPVEPDRIAALEQRVVDRIADLEYLEGRAAETIHALEQRVVELEERLRPSAQPPEGISSRQVVQITGGDNWLVALCNDGTLLQLAKGTWTELPAIPQP